MRPPCLVHSLRSRCHWQARPARAAAVGGASTAAAGVAATAAAPWRPRLVGVSVPAGVVVVVVAVAVHPPGRGSAHRLAARHCTGHWGSRQRQGHPLRRARHPRGRGAPVGGGAVACRGAGGGGGGDDNGGGARERADGGGGGASGGAAWRSTRFVVDGFPRNGSNREAWTAAGGRPAAVLELVVPPAVLRSRLLGRGEGRADDTASVVERRLAVAAAEGGSVANWYEAEGLLTRLDGGQRVEQVLDAALAALEGVGGWSGE